MSVAKIFVGYGAFLGACGWYGAMSHGYAPSVMHSLYAGAGSGFLMAFCGIGCLGAPQKGEGGYKLFMISVHIGLMLNALLAAVFGLQYYRSSTTPEKADRAPLFMIMTLGSVASLVLSVRLKPKKKKE